MILSRLHRRRNSLLSPALAVGVLIVMLASIASAPAIALAGLCAKPCCTADAQTASTSSDDCCDRQAIASPSAEAHCSPVDSQGCEIERCCSAGTEALPPPTSLQLRGSTGLAAPSPWDAFLPAFHQAGHHGHHRADVGSPHAPPLRIIHCTFLI